MVSVDLLLQIAAFLLSLLVAISGCLVSYHKTNKAKAVDKALITKQLSAVERRAEACERRLTALPCVDQAKDIIRLEGRLNAIEARFDSLDRRIDALLIAFGTKKKE